MDVNVDQDYYRILGVDADASASAIRRAYRKRALKCHPDMGGSHETMAAIIEAREILQDPERRAEYDRSRPKPPGQATATAQPETAEPKARVRVEPIPVRVERDDEWTYDRSGPKPAAQANATAQPETTEPTARVRVEPIPVRVEQCPEPKKTPWWREWQYRLRRAKREVLEIITILSTSIFGAGILCLLGMAILGMCFLLAMIVGMIRVAWEKSI